MPTVPQYSRDYTPTVSPGQPGGLRSQSVQATSSAFGGDVARAQAGAGEDLQRAGKIIFNRAYEVQEMQNQANARDATNKFVVEMGEATVQYNMLEGKASLDGYKAHVENVQKIHDKYLNQMGSESARKFFMNDSQRQLSYNISQSSYRAAEQGKKYRNEVSTNAIIIGQNNAAVAPDDEKFGIEIDGINKQIDVISKENFLSPEKTQVIRDEQISKAYAKRISNIAMTQPLRAQKMLNDNRDKIKDADSLSAVEKTVYNSVMTHGAKQLAQEEVEGNTLQGYYRKTKGAESASDPNAKNEKSTATGLFQFLHGTWKDVSRRHPELNLTPEGRTDEAQSQRAMEAFTKDNADLLKASGNQLTFQNLYTAHFLGGPGALRFLEGIQTDPNAPASNYVSAEAVAANPETFKNKDGTIRSAKQVYGILGSRVGGGVLSGGLTPNTTPGQFATMAERVRARAEAIMPGNTEFARSAVSELQTSYNLVKAAADDISKGYFQGFSKSLVADKITSMDQLFSGNPNKQEAFAQLSAEQQNSIRRAIEHNATGKDAPWTDAAKSRYNELLKMSFSNPDEFAKVMLPGETVLPKAQMLELMQKQVNPQKSAQSRINLVSAMAQLGPMVDDLGIRMHEPARGRYDKDLSNQFIGEFSKQLDEKLKEKQGKALTTEEIRGIAAGIVKETTVPGRIWGTNNVPIIAVPMSDVFVKRVQEKYESTGRVATPEIIRHIHTLQMQGRTEEAKRLLEGTK